MHFGHFPGIFMQIYAVCCPPVKGMYLFLKNIIWKTRCLAITYVYPLLLNYNWCYLQNVYWFKRFWFFLICKEFVLRFYMCSVSVTWKLVWFSFLKYPGVSMLNYLGKTILSVFCLFLNPFQIERGFNLKKKSQECDIHINLQSIKQNTVLYFTPLYSFPSKFIS